MFKKGGGGGGGGGGVGGADGWLNIRQRHFSDNG